MVNHQGECPVASRTRRAGVLNAPFVASICRYSSLLYAKTCHCISRLAFATVLSRYPYVVAEIIHLNISYSYGSSA